MVRSGTHNQCIARLHQDGQDFNKSANRPGRHVQNVSVRRLSVMNLTADRQTD